MKRILLLVIIITSLAAIGQKRMGIGLGLNATQYACAFHYSAQPVLKPLFTPTLSLVLDLPINTSLGIISGINYVQKGGQIDFEGINKINQDINPNTKTNYNVDSYSKRRLNYIEIPVSLALKVNRFRVFGGGYFAYLLGGKLEEKIRGTEQNLNPNSPYYGEYGTINVDKNKEVKLGNYYDQNNLDDVVVKSYDLGFQLGFTVMLHKDFYIYGQYSKGLRNYRAGYKDSLGEIETPNKEYNQAYSLKFVYLLGGKQNLPDKH